MATKSAASRVVIAGAGPVGMVCALALAQRGIAVTVFELEPAPVTDQRAASIHPPTLPLGLVSPKYRYHDRVACAVVAEFDLANMRDVFRFPFVLQYEQYKLTAAIAAKYATTSDFDVRFAHRVAAIAQRADGVDVEVVSAQGRERHRAAYLIGCDGGRSTVRTHAGIEFEGFTYREKFIKIATTFDFAKINRELVFRNYFSDPDEWLNLFKVRGESSGGLWRAVFPLNSRESERSALSPERIESRLQRFFPKQGRYEIAYANVYQVSQLVAKSFRKGRILLAGDISPINWCASCAASVTRVCSISTIASGVTRRWNTCRRRRSPTSACSRNAIRRCAPRSSMISEGSPKTSRARGDTCGVPHCWRAWKPRRR